VNCLPGVTFGGLSCHDHEGDWEGVTVVLRHSRGRLRPLGALYDAHGRSVRWQWADIEHEGSRPKVYVAAGSHASYPAPCRANECDQRLSGTKVGDGGYDGEAPRWKYNDGACDGFWLQNEQLTHGPCLVALPSRRDERRGVLWNAFAGRWGKARCAAIGRVCVQVNGPKSPSLQDRFRWPDDPEQDDPPVCGPRGDLYELRVEPMPPQHQPYPGC